MRNAAHVQNIPRNSRVIFTSFGGFIFTCYFFHELETSIVPSTLSYWLYRPGIRTTGETMEKEQTPTSAGRAHSHVPSSSLSQSNLTPKGWPGVMGLGQVSRRGNMGCAQVECNGFMNTLLLLLSRFSRVRLCATPETAAYHILQARTLEWVAISFSNAWEWNVKVKSLSPVQLFVTAWTAAHQPPLSMGFSKQEYWSGVPLPSPLPGYNLQTQKWSYWWWSE